jgi:putative transcriptional regulator
VPARRLAGAPWENVDSDIESSTTSGGPSPGPQSHFAVDLVLENTVGTASEGAGLAVACHLALCGVCRRLAADLERIGDSLLQAERRFAPRPELRARILADAGPQPPPTVSALPSALIGTLPPVPPPLVEALAALRGPRWRWQVPGLRAITLHERDGSVARLLRLRPGMVIPSHDHGGPEHTVIFGGGLDDEHVCLGRGDALTMHPGDQHQQRAAPGADCIALVVNEAPPRPITLRGRILKRLARL